MAERQKHSAQNRYTEAEKKTILDAYKNGTSQQALHKQYGISTGTLYYWTHKNGKSLLQRRTSKNPRMRRYSEEEKKKILKAKAEGLTGAELKRRFGISNGTIRWWENPGLVYAEQQRYKQRKLAGLVDGHSNRPRRNGAMDLPTTNVKLGRSVAAGTLRFCTQCGTRCRSEWVFCGACGSRR